jgi:hypothetical protein
MVASQGPNDGEIVEFHRDLPTVPSQEYSPLLPPPSIGAIMTLA